MAAGQKTLADLIVINNENLSGGIADELLQDAPLVRVMAAMESSNGSQHQHLRYDDPPVANFRDINAGRDLSHSTDTNVTISCEILDASSLVDAAAADAYRFGRAAYVERENRRSLRSAFQRLERSVINGTVGSFGDAAGFAGFLDQAELQAIGAQTIDAGGATNLTSAYVIRSADPMDTAAIIMGQDGNIMIGTTTEQLVQPTPTTAYNGLWTPIHSWYAYQHASTFSVVRIANIDSASATPQLTDDLIGDAVSRFPIGRGATHIVYNRNAWRQHRASRTATNATGSEAPFPMDAYGLPIVVTDQIPNDETAVT